MKYETVAQLKKAGFPQPTEGLYEGTYNNEHKDLDSLGVYFYTPSLSELIEACGDELEAIVRTTQEQTSPWWRAYPTDEAYKGECVVDCCGYEVGDTPEEAVAKLWLALHGDNPKQNK